MNSTPHLSRGLGEEMHHPATWWKGRVYAFIHTVLFRGQSEGKMRSIIRLFSALLIWWDSGMDGRKVFEQSTVLVVRPF